MHNLLFIHQPSIPNQYQSDNLGIFSHNRNSWLSRVLLNSALNRLTITSTIASNSHLSSFTMLSTIIFFFLVHSNSLSIKSKVITFMKPPINVRRHIFPLARTAITVPWIIQAERLQSVIGWQRSQRSGRSSSHWRAPLSNSVWQVKTNGTGLLPPLSSHCRSGGDWDFSSITSIPRKPQRTRKTDRCWKWILSKKAILNSPDVLFKLAWLMADVCSVERNL